MAGDVRILKLTDELHMPIICNVCGGVLVYKGLGEYRCEDCGKSEYDDYGKVRNFLEKHKGANVNDISVETGVSRKSIRTMVKENRFEVIETRSGYLRCEMCGVEIKSGHYCPKCEEILHRGVEKEARNERHRQSGMSGFGEAPRGDDGSKRFTRER
ncbi:MAG: hypothetical protein NC400_14530 [Clostridium sp.]|nr:hypothetical protein [Clostridium sp.]